MLQLRHKECLPSRIYSSEIGYRGGSFVSPALRIDPIFEGHELGHFTMATTHRGPLILAMACVCSHRLRTTPCQTLNTANDCEIGGDVEGQLERDYC